MLMSKSRAPRTKVHQKRWKVFFLNSPNVSMKASRFKYLFHAWLQHFIHPHSSLCFFFNKTFRCFIHLFLDMFPFFFTVFQPQTDRSDSQPIASTDGHGRLEMDLSPSSRQDAFKSAKSFQRALRRQLQLDFFSIFAGSCGFGGI